MRHKTNGITLRHFTTLIKELTKRMTYNELRTVLTPLYGTNEARAMADYLLGEVFGLTKADIICGAVERLSAYDNTSLNKMVGRLLNAEPVQYVVGAAWFCSRRFKVAKGVLIPRPETEELCAWITADSGQTPTQKVLDIGTGSGCIACTLALDIKDCNVTAWDISPKALGIARENASWLNANVVFKIQDALNVQDTTDRWDVIGSNPPYICDKEKNDMERNVLEHEPHSALFVPDDDPLLFYRAIARYAVSALNEGGRLYYEINPIYADETVTMLADTGFKNIETKLDAFGKKRMVKALRD